MKIDTSTTSGKIKVQQAWIDRECIFYKAKQTNGWMDLNPLTEPVWAWGDIDYKLKPQTVEEAAEVHVGECASSDGHKERAIDFIAGVEWRDENPKEDQ